MNVRRYVVIAGLAGIFLSSMFTGASAHAADARNFNAGRIIDDGVFMNSDSMSVAQIQDFLNSKTVCDNWGQKNSELGGGTRAQWLAAHGISTPITCLRDYYENPATAENNYGRGIPDGAISAARIIYNYSKQFNINPQVLLVTLQKENGLVTDEWPTPKQYREAMGFGCPDNVAPGAPACDPSYGSFSTQIYQAARHFRGYIDDKPGWWIPFTTGNNNIAWSPTASCGTGNVYIENRSTVALYSYTPYQPNQAAKNAQYGSGDGCSSYGNRNFYMYFTDWFGSTYNAANVVTDLVVSHDPIGYRYTGPRTATFTVRNNSNNSVDLGNIGVASYSEQGATGGFAMKHVVLGPQESYTYSDTQNFDFEGTYKFWIVSQTTGCNYCTTTPASSYDSIARERTVSILNAPTVTQNLTLEQARSAQGGPATLSFKMRNNSDQSIDAGDMGIALVDQDGVNVGMPMAKAVVIPAQTERTISSTVTLPKTGRYSAFITNTKNDGALWDNNFPISAGGVTRSLDFFAKPGDTLQQTPLLSVASPRVGESVNASFSVKNYNPTALDDGQLGLVVNDPNGASVGFAMQNYQVGANGTFTYSVPSRSFDMPGTYTAWVAQYKNGRWTKYSNMENDSVSGSFTFTVKPGASLQQTPSLSIPSPHVGESVDTSFAVKNYTSSAIDGGQLGLVVIDPNGANEGFAMQNMQIGAGGTMNYSVPSRSFDMPGTYTAWITQYKNNYWSEYNSPESTGVSGKFTFTVKPRTTLQLTPSLSLTSPRVGEGVTATFSVKNFSGVAVDDGQLGLVVLDPSGTNVGFAMQNLHMDANGTYTYSVPARTFTTPGTYTAWITQYKNNYWSAYGNLENNTVSNSFTFTVRP